MIKDAAYINKFIHSNAKIDFNPQVKKTVIKYLDEFTFQDDLIIVPIMLNFVKILLSVGGNYNDFSSFKILF